MDETNYPPLVMVEWMDATNIPTWQDLADMPDWATNHAVFTCRNVGYLVYEDEHCVVLAARVSLGDPENQQVGLFERLPKGMITNRTVLDAGTEQE
jgi:hypothetical protein